ncbi:hypothetical protein [Escherichia phage PJNS034]
MVSLCRAIHSVWVRCFKSKLRSNGDVPSGRHVRDRGSLQESKCESFGGYTVRYAWVDELASWILHERDYQHLLIATTPVISLRQLDDRGVEARASQVLGGNGLSQTILDLHMLANSSLGSRILLRQPFVGTRCCDSLTCDCRNTSPHVQYQRAMAILDSIQSGRSLHVVHRSEYSP